MTTAGFESLLDECCGTLTGMARKEKFTSPEQFEDAVRRVLADLLSDDDTISVDFNSPAQAFPDIALGEHGVEVKFTSADTWRSVQETQRVEGVKHVYIVFGKMGGVPEARWAEYEKSVVHVRTSHVPRFEVEIAAGEDGRRESLFEQMGIHPDGCLWWLEGDDGGGHTLPIQARLYTNLTTEEKTRLRAEAALVCPAIVKSGRDRNKYDDVVLYLLTRHGVLCHQARDLFSAGSVANPKNDDEGGIYSAST